MTKTKTYPVELDAYVCRETFVFRVRVEGYSQMLDDFFAELGVTQYELMDVWEDSSGAYNRYESNPGEYSEDNVVVHARLTTTEFTLTLIRGRASV